MTGNYFHHENTPPDSWLLLLSHLADKSEFPALSGPNPAQIASSDVIKNHTEIIPWHACYH